MVPEPSLWIEKMNSSNTDCPTFRLQLCFEVNGTKTIPLLPLRKLQKIAIKWISPEELLKWNSSLLDNESYELNKHLVVQPYWLILSVYWLDNQNIKKCCIFPYFSFHIIFLTFYALKTFKIKIILCLISKLIRESIFSILVSISFPLFTATKIKVWIN